MFKKSVKKSQDKLSPQEISQWKQLKTSLDFRNKWEKQQQAKSQSRKNIQNKLNEYFELMEFLSKIKPQESERAQYLRMLHLVELQKKFLRFERWRSAKQVIRCT